MERSNGQVGSFRFLDSVVGRRCQILLYFIFMRNKVNNTDNK